MPHAKFITPPHELELIAQHITDAVLHIFGGLEYPDEAEDKVKKAVLTALLREAAIASR